MSGPLASTKLSLFDIYYSKLRNTPEDQRNFLLCQVGAILLGFPFRSVLSDKRVTPYVRHVIEISVGVAMAYFCFGSGMYHILGQSMLCYFLMLVLTTEVKGLAVFVASLGYMCVMHMLRQYYDYGGYTLDVTGPLMVVTQRLSSLGFSLQDGAVANLDSLSSTRRHYAVRKIPNIIEFLSYIFCFHSLLCGPFCFYKDYISFIEGSQYTEAPGDIAIMEDKDSTIPSPKDFACDADGKKEDPLNEQSPDFSCEAAGEKNQASDQQSPMDFSNDACSRKKDISRQASRVDMSNDAAKTEDYASNRPSPVHAMMECLRHALLCAVVLVTVAPLWPASYLEEPAFLDEPFWFKTFCIFMVTSLAKFKYYFAWKVGEAANLSCGLGFNGYDSAGKAKWDLIRLVDILGVELSLNLKTLLDNWNIATNTWLRYVVYDRVRSTTAVFMVSAFWHGFYPGYYLTFASGALFTHASRLLRRVLRESFQQNKALSMLYDGITFAVTRVLLGYLTFPFVILNFWSSIAIYKSMYFWMHICSVVVILVFTFVSPTRSSRKTKEA